MLSNTRLCLALLLLASGPATALTLDPADPLVEMACDACHLNVIGSGDVPPEGADILTDTQEQLCGLCHQQAIITGHPSGVVPASPTPVEYPLDWKQEVTCSTCHRIHAATHADNRPPPTGISDSCTGCHDR